MRALAEAIRDGVEKHLVTDFDIQFDYPDLAYAFFFKQRREGSRYVALHNTLHRERPLSEQERDAFMMAIAALLDEYE